MKHIVVVTGLVLSTPLFVACAENTKPPASASAQKAADQAEKASQQAQKQAEEARQNELAAQQKAAAAQHNLRNAQAQEAQADQRAQQASYGAGHAEQQAGAAVAPRPGVTEAQGQPTGAAGQPRKVVVVTVGLLFPRNGAELAPAAKPKLDEVATALNERPAANEVIVEGFTDDTGEASFNKTLSKGRAQAVADYLVSRGVPMDRITTKGLGQENPVSTDKTAEGRAMNRRVEILIQPVTGQPGGH